MKKYVFAQFDRLARRAGQQSPLLKKVRGDSFNVLEVAFLKAAYESAEYYEQHLITASSYDFSDLDLLSAASNTAKPEGLFLEFGVASGRTISHIAKTRSQPVYGFDFLRDFLRTGGAASIRAPLLETFHLYPAMSL